MATLTLDARDTQLLRVALQRRITLLGRTVNRNGLPEFTISGSAAGTKHTAVLNKNGRIACNCQAGRHGARCTHAAYLRAYLAWQRQQDGTR